MQPADETARKIVFTYDGEQYELANVGLADIVAFERQFNCSFATFQDADEDNPPRIEWLAFLAFRVLKSLRVIDRRQQFDENFLERLETIEAVEGEPAEEPAGNPTRAPRPV